ncbi:MULTISPECIES: hypothetical protein [Pseudoalteromonas]|uniref:Orphan protein n=1 Tax=Pseudoalteromonas translucida (strain TAC 125) TaxID=326442 RepID=Q3IJI3_PSET1|nr:MULTISPECIES: hypothetical protein [Pseudoalteromonas]MBB1405499.1 hypothetical protein [Pseudoalteromonas sp. SG44-5]MBE0420737.1 hypothetical protein [Pseudoalteromonas nigrifaciens]MBH0094531.1 hypothetical protein [Pseudoalteromonas sp. SCQQ13]MBO7927826.1 hypothetical protein [Pseudoalteromonas sp. K222D]NYR14199.1 hypothetical protein [Pseudoalteromonas sp. MIP2626]
MEFEQDSTLTLPLFLFDDTLSDRDLEQPDFEISLPLDDELLTQLCQNPSEDSSIAISVESYQLTIVNPELADIAEQQHDAQLTLTRGPLLSAVLITADQQTFVSPQMDMMPTFDLGDEDE